MKRCEYRHCGKQFAPETHNQVYCDKDCCREETNLRVMEKYYKRKAIKEGSRRICSSCKQTVLSRYNYDDECAACQRRPMTVGKELLQHLQA